MTTRTLGQTLSTLRQQNGVFQQTLVNHLGFSRARVLYDECLNALEQLLPYLTTWLSQRPDDGQRMVLEHLQTLITNQIATSKPVR